MEDTPIVGGLQLCSSSLEFPYIVIEYFRKGLHRIPSDSALKIQRQEDLEGRLLSFYDEDTQSFKVTEIPIDQNDNRVYYQRWKLVDLLVIIPPSVTQSYFSYSLDHAHYSKQRKGGNPVAIYRLEGEGPRLPIGIPATPSIIWE
jgi:hypothetical protein